MSIAAPPSSFPAFGFTTIEAVIVVALAAVLAAAALPNLRGMLERQRLRQAAADMQTAIHLARQEALRRGGQVVLRKAAPGHCATGPAEDWSCGWLLFADDNGNGRPDPDEELIRIWPPVAKGLRVTMRSPPPLTHLRVNRWGRLGSLGIFSVLLQQSETAGSQLIALCVAAGGRLQTRHGSDKC